MKYRIPGLGLYFDKMGSAVSDGMNEILMKEGMTTAFVNLKVQFYEGKGSMLGGLITWDKWSPVYTTHSMTQVPAHKNFMDGYTFMSGAEAAHGANAFINNSLNNGLLKYNKYRK